MKSFFESKLYWVRERKCVREREIWGGCLTLILGRCPKFMDKF